MDKEWIRKTVEAQVNAIYGLKNPSKADVGKMVDLHFAKCPAFQFMGYNQLNPLFGCYQGTDQLKAYFVNFYDAVEVLGFRKQFIIVDGFGASAHYAAEFRFKGSGSVYDFELAGLVDLDTDGRVRGLQIPFRFVDVPEGVQYAKREIQGRPGDHAASEVRPEFECVRCRRHVQHVQHLHEIVSRRQNPGRTSTTSLPRTWKSFSSPMWMSFPTPGNIPARKG